MSIPKFDAAFTQVIGDQLTANVLDAFKMTPAKQASRRDPRDPSSDLLQEPTKGQSLAVMALIVSRYIENLMAIECCDADAADIIRAEIERATTVEQQLRNQK